MEREFYTIETESYKQLMKEEGGNYFITFRYMLPFRLPTEDETTIVLDKCLFLASQKEYEYYALKDGFGKLPSLHTIIEGTIRLKRQQYRNILRDSDRNMRKQKSLSDAFDEQLAILNTFMEIINMKYQYLSVHNIHMGEVIGPSLFKVYKTDRDSLLEKSSNGLFLIREPSKLEAERYDTLSLGEIEFIKDNFSEFEKHPTRNIALIARKGEKAFDLHDYNNAIVHYNTVFEVVILTFIRDYNIMLNIKTEDETNKLLEAGLKNLVRKHFYDALNALRLIDADIIKVITEKYMESSYLIRNKIVHDGASYGEIEAGKTVEIIKDLTYMINDNMNKASSNPFVDMYTRYNMNYNTGLYESVKSKY